MKLTIFSWAISIFAIAFSVYIYNKYNQKSVQYLTLDQELVKYRDNENKLLSKIDAISTESTNQFLDLKTKDTTILELQKQVDLYKSKLKNKGSVTLFHTKMSIDTTLPTKVQQEGSKLSYLASFNFNKWLAGNIEANPSTTKLNLTVKNIYSVVIGYESVGFLKPKKPFALVTNFNPYSDTTTLRTYSVSVPRRKHFSLGLGPTYSLTSDLKFSFGFGVGLYYNLWSF